MRWQALLFLPLLLFLVAGSRMLPMSLAPTVLHATRTILPEYHIAPFDVTVRDARAVQRLYQAAYALQPVPSGVMFHCPSDIGLVYYLDFFQNGILIQRMSLDAMGCQFLQIGQNTARFTDQAFFDLVAQTVGLPSLIPPHLRGNAP